MTFKEALDNFWQLYNEALSTDSLRAISPLQREANRISYDLHLYYIAYRVGDTDVGNDCINDILDILASHDLDVTELPVDIINSGGGGGVIPVDGFLDWTGTIHDYRPYASRTSVGSDLKLFSDTAPNSIPNVNHTGILSLNGRFVSGSSNSLYGFPGITGVSYSGYGVYGISTFGPGIRGVSVSDDGVYGSSDVRGVSGYSPSGKGVRGQTDTGQAASFEASNNPLSTDKTSNLVETKSNENAGVHNLSGTIHYTEDNPTISGTNTKVYFTYKCGTITRTEAYPRVPDVDGNKAYLWDSETVLSSANHTEYKNHGTTIGTITANGTKEIPLGQQLIWRTTPGTNTIGDVRLMADINGFYVERWNGTTWEKTAIDITF